MINLYYTPTSCSMATHIALKEAGAEYQLNLVKLWKPEFHKAYMVINPLGTVPTIRVGSKILTENIAIMTYIASLFPDKCLMPNNSLQFAECLSFMGWLASSVQIARRQFRAPGKFSNDATTHEAISSMGQENFLDYLSIIDNRLKGQRWVMGEQFTMADAYVLVFFGWALSDGVKMDTYKYFSDFKYRMLSRPAVKSVLLTEGNILAS